MMKLDKAINVVQIVILISFFSINQGLTMMPDRNQSRNQAEATISQVLRLEGRRFSGLPSTDMVAFRDLAYGFDPHTNELFVFVLIIESSLWSASEEIRRNMEKTFSALNDPEIGGMFDTGGGTWREDPERGWLVLERRFPTDADPEAVLKASKDLQRVYADWALYWAGAVGRIVHNDEPVPTTKVTPENNPYDPTRR